MIATVRSFPLAIAVACGSFFLAAVPASGQVDAPVVVRVTTDGGGNLKTVPPGSINVMLTGYGSQQVDFQNDSGSDLQINITNAPGTPPPPRVVGNGGTTSYFFNRRDCGEWTYRIEFDGPGGNSVSFLIRVSCPVPVSPAPWLVALFGVLLVAGVAVLRRTSR